MWGRWLFGNLPNLLTDIAATYVRRVISSIDIRPLMIIITVNFLITVSYLELSVFLKSFQVHLGVKDKGKATPLQAWTGPEGSRRLRLSDFKIIGT